MIEWIILLALAIWSVLFNEVCELTDGMNPVSLEINYLIENEDFCWDNSYIECMAVC